MPLYAYLCEHCGPFERHRPMAQFREPAACPTCHESAPRMVTAVQLNLMQGNTRIAHALNERNAHEPRIATPHTEHHHTEHGPSCKHTHHHVRRKYQTSARPWQVGH